MHPLLWTAFAWMPAAFPADPAGTPAASPSEAVPVQRTGVAPLVGLQVGGHFSLTPLEAFVLPRLELGIELPWAQRRFRVALLSAWTRPAASGEDTDDRVPEGTWSWDLTQTEGLFALGATVRIPEISDRFVPEITVGPQLYLLRTRVEGEASGAPFGESVEQYTRVGFLSSLGVATVLGPGELGLQLVFSLSELDGRVTGDSSTIALAPLLGYRFVL
ncbi:MAG: hypothetical protein JXB39_05260 [Deltaproteobacteria bacterium]|nr:hypothetical protein [Deltaproteobacteria bacterium]